MNEVLNLLSSGVVKIKFTKVDGSVREMNATRSFDLIPQNMVPSGTGTKVVREGVITVFDVDTNGWRSFREDSLISYEKV